MRLFLFFLALAPLPLVAQVQPSTGASVSTVIVDVNPTGGSTCDSYGRNQQNWKTGETFGCVQGVWTRLGPRVDSAGNGVCALGDSLMNPLADVTQADTSRWQSWYNSAILLSNGAMRFVHNGGVPG